MIEISSDFNFTLASWFLGNVHIKPILTHSAPPSPCALPSKKGDGYCDPKNNNAGCDWDGGDCCPSKCSNELAKFYGEYCPCRYGWYIFCQPNKYIDECKCLDPNIDKESC